MAHTCQYQFQGKSGNAHWSLAEDTLLLLPEGGTPLPFSVKEISGIAGDGFSLDLWAPGAVLSLTKMGQDGPTLREQLERIWPALRADALRLTGTGTPAYYACRTSSPSGAKATIALLYEDVLLMAPEGEDLSPIFLPTLTSIELDEGHYAVALNRRGTPPLAVTKLAGETQEFLDRMKTARGRLTRESLEVLSMWMPSLSALQKATLAGAWPPGIFLSFEELERLCLGFKASFEKGWLSQSLRNHEGRTLLEKCALAEAFLGFARPPEGMSEPEAGEEDAPPGLEGDAEARSPQPSPVQESPILLWLLVKRKGHWLLESLTEKNHATYRFECDDEMVGLATALLCSPRFSREALYLPIDAFTGERADYAIAARDLPFLTTLRKRFKERIVHSGLGQWTEKISAT